MDVNNVDLDTLKDYLTKLKKLEAYNGYLQEHGKNDSITTLKNYFNDSINYVKNQVTGEYTTITLIGQYYRNNKIS